MRKSFLFQFYFIFIILLTDSFVTNGQSKSDSLSKYSIDELFDKAFETRSTDYLDYLSKKKLSQDEEKDLYRWYYFLASTNGKLDLTLHYLEKLDSISKSTNDPINQFLANLGVAEVYYKKSDYEQSKQSFERAQKFIKDFPEGIERSLANAEYSYFYYLSGNFDVYIVELEKSISDLRKLRKNISESESAYLENSIATIGVNLACGYIMKEDFDQAALNLKEVDSIYATNFKDAVNSTSVHTLLVKGKYHFFKKEFEKAIPYFEEVISIDKDIDFQEEAYMAQVFLGIIYYQLGDYPTSLMHTEIAINHPMVVADYVKYEMESYRYAYLASKQLGDTEKSLKYSGLFMEQDEELNDNKRSNFINSFINNLEVGKLQDDLSAKNSTNFLLKYILFGLAVLIAGLGIILFYQFKENKKNKQKISDYLAQLNADSQKKNISQDKRKDLSSEEVNEQGQSQEIDEKTGKILDKLDEFEEGDLYVDSRMSLAFLASYLSTNTITLSKIINTYKQMNFNDYINGLRIRYIIEKIKNEPKFEQYKISYLAEVSGFSSHSIFSKAFKKSTGVTPSQFLDYLKEEVDK
ncbi:helix-turn-helix domain-containing protein [Sphingobacterium endophyticum]|uniref:helix-turn-helix domain-containing protein n=1 Tax=Sphingobacterium endophyticum TaxID=2546448 RepID=UPI0012E26923|nr:helix-turn-helix domain-containing protein [Sphingobacterium endophyticum]